MWIRNFLQQNLCCWRLACEPCCFKCVDESSQILFQEIVSEIHHEIIITKKIGGDENTVSEAKWFVLRNESESGPELRTIAQSAHDFNTGVANDHSDISDTRRDHGFNAIKQDRLIGHWHQLFGAGMSDRSKTSSSTPSQNQCFHVSPSRSSAMQAFQDASYLTHDAMPNLMLLYGWAAHSSKIIQDLPSFNAEY